MTMLTPIEGITAPPTRAHTRAATPAGTAAWPGTPHPATAGHPADDDADDAYGSAQIDLDDLDEDFAHAAAHEGPQFTRSRRADGWTPDRQRAFLDYIAQGLTVADASTLVGLSATSAYAFRQRAAGAAFAVGWQAALLLQRNRLVDDLTARAFRGNTDTVTNHRGETIERHRHDNRLALALLTRLDKIAAADLPDRTGDARAARLAAQDWDRYLDLIGADASPAQAGLFLSLRTTQGDADAIAPIVALARADLYRRTRAGHPGEVPVHDLDPARRHLWSAEDWARAEAGGLVSLAAPAAEDARTSQLPQHSAWDEPEVWWCDDARDWRTAFPPPEDFDGDEEGAYGDAAYERSLSDAELDAVEAWHARELATRRAPEDAARARFFAGLVADREEDPCSGEGRRAGEREAAVAPAPACAGGRDGVGANHPLPVRTEPGEALALGSDLTSEAGEDAAPFPPTVCAGPVEAPPCSRSRTGEAGEGGMTAPQTVRGERVEAPPCSSGHTGEVGAGATASPPTVRAERVEAPPCSSGHTGEVGEGAMASPPTVRAEPVEAPLFVPQAMGQEEGQPFDRLGANGCAAGGTSPNGPAAGVNPASSDGAGAPSAGAGACGRVRSFATA